MDNQFDALIGNDIGHDLFDKETHQPFFGAVVCGRIRPHRGKASRQREQARSVGYRLPALIAFEFRQSALKLSDPGQGLVPSALKRFRYQPVLRLNCIVLPLGARRLVAGFFGFKSQRADDLVGLLGNPLRVLKRCFNRARYENPQQLTFYGGIHSEPAE
jgi:hypothetical protein